MFCIWTTNHDFGIMHFIQYSVLPTRPIRSSYQIKRPTAKLSLVCVTALIHWSQKYEPCACLGISQPPKWPLQVYSGKASDVGSQSCAEPSGTCADSESKIHDLERTYYVDLRYRRTGNINRLPSNAQSIRCFFKTITNSVQHDFLWSQIC